MERINFNTQIVTADKDFTLGGFLKRATKKVVNRLDINLEGLNTLDTTIVEADQVENILNDQGLSKVLDFSNSINRSLGIPETDNLIVRSSTTHPKNKNSEPAVLVKNLRSKNKKYEYLKDGEKKQLEKIEDFTCHLKQGSLLLMHSDNYDLQTKSVHARFYENIFGNELLAGTGVLQSRELEMEKNKKPLLRINQSRKDVISHYKIADLLKISPKMIQNMIEGGTNTIDIEGLSINLRNVSYDQIMEILKILKEESCDLINAHEAGQKLKGSMATTEVRIYQTLKKGVGSRVQVLDVD